MKNKRGILLIATGMLLIASAIGLSCYNLWDESHALQEVDRLVNQLKTETALGDFSSSGTNYIAGNNDGSDNIVSGSPEDLPAYVLNPDMEMPVETIDNRDYIGVLEIPDLELVLPIISEWSYPALKQAPCRYEGSVYQDSLIIAGHNYKSHLGRLKNLKGGEEVTFTDVEGNVFRYEVVLTEVLISTALEEMKEEAWDLTLFTCTLGGQNRITVRCDRI